MHDSQFRRLAREFYLRPSVLVAPELLGKLFVRRVRRTLLIGRIVETEAYREDDPASHSFRGRTQRTEVMFRHGGHLYVYFTYGMHFCANVVTEEEGRGEAVLIRAVEPLAGIEVMMKNRFGTRRIETQRSLVDLSNGPAKFCEAFGIGRKQNGLDLLGDEVFLLDADLVPRSAVGVSPRIGIRVATEKKWRYYIKENRWVSR